MTREVELGYRQVLINHERKEKRIKNSSRNALHSKDAIGVSTWMLTKLVQGLHNADASVYRQIPRHRPSLKKLSIFNNTWKKSDIQQNIKTSLRLWQRAYKFFQIATSPMIKCVDVVPLCEFVRVLERQRWQFEMEMKRTLHTRWWTSWEMDDVRRDSVEFLAKRGIATCFWALLFVWF